MLPFQTFTGEGAGLSVDAVGMNTNSPATVSANIPANALVEAAYLYSASVWSGPLANVTLDGTTLTSDSSSRLDVGARQANPASENRWNVTSIVSAKYDNLGGTYDFNVTELGNLDGEILSVIYSVPTEEVRTTLLYDGELATTGDNFIVSLLDPYDGTSNAFMSLGISFGFQGGTRQYTEVDINGQRLTTSAGGQDDGFDANGGLITAGGIGDDPANPADPFALPSGPRSDDELYNLASFLSLGDTSFTINTLNPSNDDNVFFMGLNLKGRASSGQENPIPEPTTMLLFGTGLLGLVGLGRKKLLKKS
jgi:hypothetical protein